MTHTFKPYANIPEYCVEELYSGDTCNRPIEDHRRPKLLDLYCCAGGSSVGYHRVGFDVTGVDKDFYKHFPYEMHVEDAIEFLRTGGHYGFDAIHASPPCQYYSAMSNCRPGLSKDYPDLIGATRELLEATGLPWVMENVVGSPLNNTVMLCGRMFGLELYRHRLFEASFDLPQPEHPKHVVPASRAGHWVPGTIMSISGHIAPIAKAREVMGIDWMNREELAEAIPPAYTEYVGQYLMEAVESAA